VPVRYVLYSHHHFDHASGGDVFAETATFIGHENMLEGIRQGMAGLPESERTDDANGNGRIERDEAAAALAAYFDDFDLNGDGAATGAEIMGAVRAPDLIYADRMTVTLGGRTVELVHASPSHSDDLSVLYFPAERAAFGVDFINVRRLPGPLDGASLDEWIASIGAMADLDYDIAIPGHGAIGSREDIAAYQRYFEDLQDAVDEGIANGASVADLQQSVRLDAYADWDRYETQLAAHIAEVYESE
jgi:glyoxylase-like metal-dependent hydrolase (beta-lactamase superfamily II)